MLHRMLYGSIFIAWLIAMCWLLTTKVMPPMFAGQQPTYQTMLPAVASNDVVWWDIKLNGDSVGTAINHIQRNGDGGGSVETTVELKQLSFDAMIRELTKGAFSFLQRGMDQSSFGTMNLKIKSNLEFDVFGELSRFDSKVTIDELSDFIDLSGIVNGEQLRLTIYTKTYADGSPKKIYDNTLKVPQGTLMSDAFTPQPRLARLQVGQTWSFQRYQPMNPANPIEMMQATVQRRDSLVWNGDSVTANVVAIRRDPGGSVTAARTPLGYVWALKDGTVVRQESTIGNMKIVFDRIPTPSEALSSGETAP